MLCHGDCSCILYSIHPTNVQSASPIVGYSKVPGHVSFGDNSTTSERAKRNKEIEEKMWPSTTTITTDSAMPCTHCFLLLMRVRQDADWIKWIGAKRDNRMAAAAETLAYAHRELSLAAHCFECDKESAPADCVYRAYTFHLVSATDSLCSKLNVCDFHFSALRWNSFPVQFVVRELKNDDIHSRTWW